MIKPWQWVENLVYQPVQWELRDGRGRNRATIWTPRYSGGEFVWHTWNENGTGGENAAAPSLVQAKDECVAAIVRQGWAPGGWEVVWI